MARDCPRVRGVVLILTHFVVFTTPVSSQDSKTGVEAIEQRLEQIERDNRLLRDRIAELEEVDRVAAER